MLTPLQHFSIHAGMGAGLLKTPDKLANILERLVSDVGNPNSKPISVKIRLLDPHSDTLALVDRLAKTGISHLTVHCRTTPMRPKEPAIRTVLADIARICHDNGITCYANGDVSSRKHAEELCEEYGVDGCMIARAAEANPSVFSSEGPIGWQEVAKHYVETSLAVRNHHANTKFLLTHIVPGKSELYKKCASSKTNKEFCEIFGVEYNGYEDVAGVKGKAKRKAAEAEAADSEQPPASKLKVQDEPTAKTSIAETPIIPPPEAAQVSLSA